MNELKQDLWSKAGVGIPHLDSEANDAVILGYQVAEFLSEVNWIFFMIVMIDNFGSLTFRCSHFSEGVNSNGLPGENWYFLLVMVNY